MSTTPTHKHTPIQPSPAVDPAEKSILMQTAPTLDFPAVQITGEEIVEALQHPSVVLMVRSILVGYGLADSVDDVLSETAERALRQVEKFDPERGTVRVWIKVLARSRALDWVNRHRRQIKLQKALDHDALNTRTSVFAVSQDDDAEEIVDRLTGQQHAHEVTQLIPSFCSNPDSWMRFLTLDECKGDMKQAAWRLGIGEDALKDSRREVIRLGQVISKALRFAQTGQPVTVGALFGCLPRTSEIDQHWSEIVMKVSINLRGFQHVTPEDIVRTTTFSMNTARQYLRETQHLLNVANTVIVRGQAMLRELDTHPGQSSGQK